MIMAKIRGEAGALIGSNATLMLPVRRFMM